MRVTRKTTHNTTNLPVPGDIFADSYLTPTCIFVVTHTNPAFGAHTKLPHVAGYEIKAKPNKKHIAEYPNGLPGMSEVIASPRVSIPTDLFLDTYPYRMIGPDEPAKYRRGRADKHININNYTFRKPIPKIGRETPKGVVLLVSSTDIKTFKGT